MEITKHRPKHIFEENAFYFITGRTYAGLPHLYSKERKLIFKDILFEKIKKFGWKLPGWIILNSHYHLQIDPTNRSLKAATPENDVGVATFRSRLATTIPKFINELHGKTSFIIKKLPPAEIINEEQIIYRKKTPLEGRINNQLERILHEVATGSSNLQVAINDRSLKAATLEQVEQAIKRKNFSLAKVLLITYLPKKFDIPFWYQYTDHVIRSERDYYMHLNYIHQNCVKHGLVKNMWDYPFSSIHEYDKALIQDSFAKYPIIDFTPGGSSDL